jgi:hypothetical protein
METANSKKEFKEVKKGPLFFLLIANGIWNIAWIIALAIPCVTLISEAGGSNGAFDIIFMFFFLIFALLIIAIIGVHVISLIALIKIKAGDFDKLKMYYVGSIAWVILCVLHAAQEPVYRTGSIPSAIIGLGFIFALMTLVKKEKEKNISEF